MKVEVIKTLKISSENIVSKGVVFSDPVPEHIMREVRLGSKAVRVIDSRPPVSVQFSTPEIEPTVVAEAAKPIQPRPASAPIKKPNIKRERKRLVK
jgi:hypothetical protein